MAMIFFLGQTKVAFSQYVPPCHYGDDGHQRLLTSIDKYGYCWSWNSQYGPTPPPNPDPPPCPGIFMCITSLPEEATSCGPCSGGDTARGGKFFHFRNFAGTIIPLDTVGVFKIDYVEITGTQMPSANNVVPLAEICYAKRNFGVAPSTNDWWLSYDLNTGAYSAVTPAQCFTPTTWVEGGNTVFKVRLQCTQQGPPLVNDPAYLIKQGNHLTSVIWGMNTITKVVIHYDNNTSFTIPNPTVNTTRCPDGSATDCQTP